MEFNLLKWITDAFSSKANLKENEQEEVMSFDNEIHLEIYQKLQKLKRLDKRFAIFGAGTHKYNLGSKLEINDVLKFEEDNGIVLPEDYKDFLVHLGNGGAGQAFGLDELEEASWSFRDIRVPFKGVDYLTKTYTELYWQQDREKLISLYGDKLMAELGPELELFTTTDLFKVAIKANLSFDGQRFWFYGSYKHFPENPLSNLDDVYLEVDADKEFTGCLYLFSEGCGHVYGLIVNGVDYGKMVFFGNDGQFDATGKSFIEFYLTWLDESIAKLEKIRHLLRVKDFDTLFAREIEGFYGWEIENITCSVLDVYAPKITWGTAEYKKFILGVLGYKSWILKIDFS